MNMLHIRTATVSDAATIAEYQVLMARETEGLELDPPTVARGVRAVFADPAKGTYYVAEETGRTRGRGNQRARLAGCLLITPEWSDWRSAWLWWIQSVYVAPESRRRGVFGALYRHVLGLARRSPDVRGLRLYVDRRNAAARKVYESLGMDGDHYRLYEWVKP